MVEEWILFSGPNCPWCDRAKALLDTRGITYTEIKIDSRDKFQYMQEYAPGARTVPVIWHRGTTLVGYPALVEYLDTI